LITVNAPSSTSSRRIGPSGVGTSTRRGTALATGATGTLAVGVGGDDGESGATHESAFTAQFLPQVGLS
jgi:hypothetical protein